MTSESGSGQGNRQLSQKLGPRSAAGKGSPPGAGDPWSALGSALAGSGMEIPFLEEMQEAFGQGFSGVKAVMGGGALGDAGANAATDGTTITFKDASPDKTVVAEELVHVLQMGLGLGGQVESDTISSPTDPAELEAKRVAQVVASGGKAPAIKARPRAGIHRNSRGGSEWPPGFSPSASARKIRTAVQGLGTDERAVLDTLYTNRKDMTRAIASAYYRMYGETLDSRIRSEMSGDDEAKALRLLYNARFTLADKIRESVDGWGTNETAIFNGLERATASDLEELRNSPDLLAHLRTDLNDANWELADAYIHGKGLLAAKLRLAANGWGTDEDAIWKAIDSANQDERDFVRAQSWARSRLSSELNDADYARAMRMLEGALTSLDRVEIAVSGWGTTETDLKAALEGLTQAEFDTMAAGEGKYVRSVAHLGQIVASELSGDDRLEAERIIHQKRLNFDGNYRTTWLATQESNFGEAALGGEGASVLVAAEGQSMSSVGRLLVACKGAGTDDEGLWDVLSDMSESERSFIRIHNPENVLGVMYSDLNTSDYARAMRALRGGAGGSVAILESAVIGAGTNERALYDMIDRIVSEGTGPEIATNQGIMKRIRGDVSQAQYLVFKNAIQSGEFLPEERLRFATAMAGTMEDLTWELCGQHGVQWRDGDGVKPDIDQILQSELDTRDYWKAIDLIRGEPETDQDKLARAKELLERERGGVSTAIMDSMSYSGENADEAWREYQGTYNQAYADGQVSQEESQLMERDREHSLDMTAEYQAAKGTVAQWATNIAVAIVGIAATILTAGAAGPFVLALGGKMAVAAQAMVLAAAMKVGINKAVQGEGYDMGSAQAFIDAASGALEAGLMIVGNVVAQRAIQGLTQTAKSVGPGVTRAFGGAGQRILNTGIEGTIDGAIGGVGEGLFISMAQEETWEGEMEDFFSKVGTTTLLTTGMSAAGGFIGGAGLRSIGEGLGPLVRARMSKGADELLPAATSDKILGRNSDALASSTDDQAQLFNSAVETNQRMQGISDEVTNELGTDRSLMGLKGNQPGATGDGLSQEGFIGGVMEKNSRKGYKNVGEMTDMSRGRLEFDGADQADAAALSLKEKLTKSFGAENIDYTGPRGDYKRHHILARDPATGVWHEFQVGPKAITEFIEGLDVALPSGVKLHAEPNFHTVKYDVLDNLRKPDVLERLGLPEDMASRVGLDELDPKYNQLFRESGQTTAGKSLPDNFAARQQELANEMAEILERLEAHEPGLTQKLDLKLSADVPADLATGALGHVAAKTDLPASAADAPVTTKAEAPTPNAAAKTTPGAHGTGTRRAPGQEADADFFGGRTTDEEALLIKQVHGIDPDGKLPGFNTVPEEWLPRYVELIEDPVTGKVTRKFNKALSEVWGVKAGADDHAALAALRATEELNARMAGGELPTGKYAWTQYGNSPKEAIESLERLNDVYRLMDNKVPTGNPTARARAAVFRATRDWIEASERQIDTYFEEMAEWRRLLPSDMDPSVAMLSHDQLGLAAPPARIFKDLEISDMSPWKSRIDELGIDVDRLRNPGVTGGRASRSHWMDGTPVSADEAARVADEAAASDAMGIGDQIAGLQSGKARSARDVLVAAETGIIPRYVARVGKYADSFSNRTSGDIYAADVADLRGLDGNPEEAMRMVGWEKSWIDSARAKGSDVYVTIVDTQAVGWKTSEIDMTGIQRTALRDIADSNSSFAAHAAEAGIKADDLPSLFDELDQLAPGADRPSHLKPFANALDESYGLNSLYSGAGFTVTDASIAGRAGNVGAREIKVSGDNLDLDPAGRNVWWFSQKIGTLSPSSP